MCKHRSALDNELKERRIKETFRGESWSDNAPGVVYYDCVLDMPDFTARSVRISHGTTSKIEVIQI